MGSKVTVPATTDPTASDWQNFIAWTEKGHIGKIDLSLTNFTTSDEPAIAAGSVVEILGSLYAFSADESITGWAAISDDEDAYIKLVTSGSSVAAEFTATAPTWSDAKQGWYDSTGADRYVAGLYKTSSTEYDRKYIYDSVLRGNNTFTGDNTFSGDNTFMFPIASGTTIFKEKASFSSSSTSYIVAGTITMPCYGTVNMYALHTRANIAGTATSYLRFTKNGVELQEWGTSGFTPIARNIDVDVECGDVLNFETRTTSSGIPSELEDLRLRYNGDNSHLFMRLFVGDTSIH